VALQPKSVDHVQAAAIRTGIRPLTNYKPLADARLDQIARELASEFAAHPLREGLAISTADSSMRVLRRILNLAVGRRELASAPKTKTLPGEARRERVITPEEEVQYLAATAEPLASIATVLADTGMRPEECFRLSWENATWVNGRNGALLATRGKTAAARGAIPMTPRVRLVLEARWDASGKRQEGYIWPAPTRSGHVEPSSVRRFRFGASSYNCCVHFTIALSARFSALVQEVGIGPARRRARAGGRSTGGRRAKIEVRRKMKFVESALAPQLHKPLSIPNLGRRITVLLKRHKAHVIQPTHQMHGRAGPRSYGQPGGAGVAHLELGGRAIRRCQNLAAGAGRDPTGHRSLRVW